MRGVWVWSYVGGGAGVRVEGSSTGMTQAPQCLDPTHNKGGQEGRGQGREGGGGKEGGEQGEEGGGGGRGREGLSIQ